MKILWETCLPSSTENQVIGIGISIFIVLVLFFLALRKLTKRERPFATLLFIYHSFFTVAYLIFADNIPGWRTDAYKMFIRSCTWYDSWFDSYGTAIKSIIFTIYPFSNTLNMSFLSISIIYSFIGYLGILCCWLAIRRYLANVGQTSKLASLLFFWPSFHFFTATIGKDSWSVLCLGLVLLSTLSWRRYRYGLFACLIIILHVRPYLFFILAFSFVCAQTISSGYMSGKTKAVSVVLLVALTIPALNFFKQHLRVEELAISTLEERYQSRLDRQIGTSYVDIRQLSLPEKSISFLFRPLFFDATSNRSFLASIENAMLIAALVLFVKIKTMRALIFSRDMFIKYLLILFPTTLVFMAHVTPNLGAAFRKKYLILIPLGMLIVLVQRRKDTRAAPIRHDGRDARA